MPNEDGLSYTVQSYSNSLFGFFGNWYDVESYRTLDKAKEAMAHLYKPDIYD